MQFYAVLLSLVPRRFKLVGLDPRLGLFVQNTLIDREANSGFITVPSCDADDLDELVIFCNGESCNVRVGENFFIANLSCYDSPSYLWKHFCNSGSESTTNLPDYLWHICADHPSILSLETALKNNSMLKSKAASPCSPVAISSLHSLAVSVIRSTQGTVRKLCCLFWKTSLSPDARLLISEAVWTNIKSKLACFD